MFPLTEGHPVLSDQSSTSAASSESKRQSNAILDQVATNTTLDTVNPLQAHYYQLQQKW